MVLALFTPIYSWVFDLFEKPLAHTWENQGEVFTGAENFFQSLYGKKQILAENETLKNQIVRLEIDNLRTRYLSEELEKIQNISLVSTGIIPAHILRQGTLGARDSLIIDQGMNSGVQPGDQVVAYENVLLGFVSEVYDTTARVTLYSHPEQEIHGVLFPHNVNLVAKGYGKGSFLIETPREIEAEAGDLFYSLKQPGQIVAMVRDVVFDPRDPFKQVYLSYPVNISEIQIVGIKKAPTSINIE